MSGQGGLAKEKPVYENITDPYIYSYDITVRIVYLEIPILFTMTVIPGDFSTKIYLGPSYRLGIIDITNKSNRTLIYNSDDYNGDMIREEIETQFVQGDFDNSLPRIVNSGFGLNVGLLFQYKFVSFDFMYSYGFNKIGQVDQFYFIDKRTHAVHFLLGINF